MNSRLALGTILLTLTGLFLLFDSANPTIDRRMKSWQQKLAVNFQRLLADAGLGSFNTSEILLNIGVAWMICLTLSYFVFGSVLIALGVSSVSPFIAVAILRAKVDKSRTRIQNAWPAIIEEIRVLVGSAGSSIPNAVIRVGKHSIPELRPTFAKFEFTWSLTTDIDAALSEIRTSLCDPTADLICDTLSIAYHLGGSDVSNRLTRLASDRAEDNKHRRNAVAQQSGVRFARRFVLIVPIGMALVGSSIGSGRDSYTTTSGLVGVSLALLILGGCWIWSGVLIRIPDMRSRILP